MTGSPRIGLFTPAWPGHNTPNGIATAVYNLATGLQATGRTPVIITPVIDGSGPPDIPVVTVLQLPWRLQDRLRSKFGFGLSTDALEQHWLRCLGAATQEAVRQHGIEVLLMEETNGRAQAVHSYIPVVVVLHGPWVIHKKVASLGPAEDQQREAREVAGFRAAAGLIGPSRNVLAAVEGTTDLSHIPKTVLPNALWCEQPSRPSAALPTRDILFVGRVDFHKGADTVFDAFARLSATHPDVRLTFVGPQVQRGHEGPDLGLEKLMGALPAQVAARIDYKGALDRHEVARLRQTHAIALIASRYENLNYTLLEAMAAGQAIVSTAVGGPAEILEHGKTALLVPPETPEAMAGGLARLIDDAALAQRLGTAAQAKLISAFNPRTVAEQTVAFLDEVLNSPAP